MTVLDPKSYTCCFTGHRDFKASYSEKEIAKWLRSEILLAAFEGYSVFITGMCYGIDIIAAEEVLKLKDEGNNKLFLIAATPYIGFDGIMSEQWKARYSHVMDRADRIYPVCGAYSKSCFSERNRWMVDHSSRLIAVYNGSKGGTRNTVMYAESKKLTLRLAPKALFN